MAILIKVAETAEEIDGLFRTRHKVFVEEGGYMAPRPDGRIFDRFDAYPNDAMANIIAVDDGHVVGGVRVIKATAVGLPTDHFFDFSSYIRTDISEVGNGGMFCLESGYRQSRIAFYLMSMVHYWFLSKGLSQILVVINPEIKNLLTRVGYKPVAPEMYDEEQQLPFVPMILYMNDLSGFHRRFAETQQGDKFLLAQTVPNQAKHKARSVSSDTERRYPRAA